MAEKGDRRGVKFTKFTVSPLFVEGGARLRERAPLSLLRSRRSTIRGLERREDRHWRIRT